MTTPDTTNKRRNPAPDTIERRVVRIPCDLIDIDSQDLREITHDDALTELAADIASKGLLQPIGIEHTSNGRYQLLWGKRRLTAHRLLRCAEIRAIIYDRDEYTIKAIALAENLHRRQLTLTEECAAVTHMHEVDNKSPDQIAAACSKSRAWVLRRLMAANLQPDLRAPLFDGTISLACAEILAELPDLGMRQYATHQTIIQRLTSSQCRAMVDVINATPNIDDAITAGLDVLHNPNPRQPILMPCAVCATPRPLADLTPIRVCSDTCYTATTTPPATQPTTTEDNTDANHR